MAKRKQRKVWVELVGGPFDGAEWQWVGSVCSMLDLEWRPRKRKPGRRHLYRLDASRCVVTADGLQLASYRHVPEGASDASSAF